ncbi:MAG: UDP-glucose 4-epimerase GalE [Flavobacterium sp.]
MKNILVTGGLGYIGSHTVIALQQAGFNVYIIDDLSNSQLEVWEKITAITGVQPIYYNIDLKDYNAVSVFFQSHKIDGIIHFAAYKAVGESVAKPLMYYRNNLLGLMNVLEAMEENQLDNFIFSSSCTVYGQADTMPINEMTPLKRPESPYGNTKKVGEEIIEDFIKITDKNAISLRYFNPVGSESQGLLGDLQIIPNNLMPYILQTAVGIRESLGVFGNDYETRDGTAVRDYIDVNDLADAHVKAIQRLLDGKNKSKLEFFNLGSGTGSTVLEIVTAFEQANNLKINYEIKPRRAGDIVQAYADYSFAKSELDWEPKTPLQISMQTAWKFQQQLDKVIE